MENSSEFYYEKLKNADNPGVVLATFYCSQYDIKITRSEVIMFNKLIRTYGRFIAFFSILDVTSSYQDRPENPYPLFGAICKRRFETTHLDSTVTSRQSLDSYIKKLEEEAEAILKRKKKLTVPPLEGNK